MMSTVDPQPRSEVEAAGDVDSPGYASPWPAIGPHVRSRRHGDAWGTYQAATPSVAEAMDGLPFGTPTLPNTAQLVRM